MKNDLEKFEEIFGHGHFRNIRNGVEVRVQDLDRSKIEAIRVIEKNGLNLEVKNTDARLRSFDVLNKEVSNE